MHIFDVIEYQGDNQTLVHKHEATDFNTHSTLVVRESQRAILFKDGQALDMFGPGRHVLHTDNIPLLRRVINIPTNGETPFKCEVYFINKTEQMAIKWGVGDVDFRDPYFNNYRFVIGANGELSIRVTDERRLIVNLVGTETDYSQEHFMSHFKSMIMMHAKSALPKLLGELKASVYSLESDLPGLSRALQAVLAIEMLDYGISIERLWINAILKPENDKNFVGLNELYAQNTLQATQAKNDYEEMLRQKTIELERIKRDKEIRLIEKQTEFEMGKMDIGLKGYELKMLGITRAQELGFEVMNNIAKNEGIGSDVRNMGMGLGMGIGVGGTFGNAINYIAKDTMGGLLNPLSPKEEANPLENVSNLFGAGQEGVYPHEVNLDDWVREETEDSSGNRTDDSGKANLDIDGNTNETKINSNAVSHDLEWFDKETDKLVLMKKKELLTPEEFETKRQELIAMIGKG